MKQKNDSLASIAWKKVRELGLTDTEAGQVVSNLKEFFCFTDAQAELAEFILEEIDKGVERKENESRSK